ncbi:hypothetical protein MLPF_1840 [Mycobacterium lepromatosis]|nr:hypothetical protein MLPF_1840 [Mycobacterium lepromatosis]
MVHQTRILGNNCCIQSAILQHVLVLERYHDSMTVTVDRNMVKNEFTVEEISTGIFASGYGQVGDGRSFSFHIEHRSLVVEIYRIRWAGSVSQAEEVVARAIRELVDIDLTDERSLAAAVRDSVARALPVSR